MSGRRIILRVLLASLALAAAAGVLAVLFTTRWAIYRVMWTGFTTAGASALLLPMTLLLDRERTRPAGLFGASWIVFLFIDALALTWADGLNWSEERLGITLFVAVAVGLLMFVGFVMFAIRAARWTGSVLVGALGASFVVLLAATWVPARVWDESELLTTGWMLYGMAIPAALSMAGFRAGDRPWWRWLGIAAALVAIAAWCAIIWSDSEAEETGFVITSVAVTVAYVNVIMLLSVRGFARQLRVATIGAAILCAALLDWIVVAQMPDAESLIARSAAAAGVLTACGTMALAIFSLVQRRGDLSSRASIEMGRVRVALTCPRCRRRQQIGVGPSVCEGCGLRIHLRLEEPCCPECGYLLYGGTSGRCPECGVDLGAGGGGSSEP